jgi:catechol 2,3-dioxygenase-like lactoylglutathione lyase family enzyme
VLRHMPYVFLYVSDLERSRGFYERQLGLHAVEVDDHAVKYDCGTVLLTLNLVGSRPRRDTSSLVVFGVEDAGSRREELAGRGVAMGRLDRYEVGATCNFFDPDGHFLCIYEPGAEALTWPSGPFVRRIMDAGGCGGALGGALGGAPVAYLFLFVRDTGEAARFYGDTLGLRRVEHSEHEGVSKFDVGGFMLSIHPAHGQGEQPPKAISYAFHVSDCEQAAARLGARDVSVGTVRGTEIGRTASFRDPSGHSFYLYEPSERALGWPSGAAYGRLTAASVGENGRAPR